MATIHSSPIPQAEGGERGSRQGLYSYYIHFLTMSTLEDGAPDLTWAMRPEVRCRQWDGL
jgi:hypothetical protein